MSRGRKRLDLTGQSFGRLTAMEVVGTPGHGAMWLCRCQCGQECVAAAGNLRAGRNKSCGCLRTEVSRVSVKDATERRRSSNLARKWFG